MYEPIVVVFCSNSIYRRDIHNMRVKLIDGGLEVEVTLRKLVAGEYDLVIDIPEAYKREIITTFNKIHIMIKPMPTTALGPNCSKCGTMFCCPEYHEGDDDDL